MMDRQHSVLLGVDGGYSGTRALVIDAQATVLGYGAGGNANHAGQGYESAVRQVITAVRQACQMARIEESAITAAYFALAGDDVEDDHLRLHEELERALPDLHFQLCNDVWAGLRAGSISGFGIAVNCGSGCGAVGRHPTGKSLIIPDLGYIHGDSGGGGQIAKDAFRAVIRAWDGRGEATTLTKPILALTGQDSIESLYLALYRNQIAFGTIRGAATQLVLQAAAGNDAPARAILQRIGDELGVSAVALTRRLGMQDAVFPFVLTGGVFRTLQSPLAEAAIARLHSVAPHCHPTLPLLLPVAGAALLACDSAGEPVTTEHYTRLQEQGYRWHIEEQMSQ